MCKYACIYLQTGDMIVGLFNFYRMKTFAFKKTTELHVWSLAHSSSDIPVVELAARHIN